MKKDYPYKEYENDPAWCVIEHAIKNLVNNKDIIEKTHRKYIIGYLIKMLKINGIV